MRFFDCTLYIFMYSLTEVELNPVNPHPNIITSQGAIATYVEVKKIGFDVATTWTGLELMTSQSRSEYYRWVHAKLTLNQLGGRGASLFRITVAHKGVETNNMRSCYFQMWKKQGFVFSVAQNNIFYLIYHSSFVWWYQAKTVTSHILLSCSGYERYHISLIIHIQAYSFPMYRNPKTGMGLR